uniref:Secreted protein n=1 Tax=Arundo donax TaxID=35708 RepID=A0A0A9EQF0_ARUDO
MGTLSRRICVLMWVRMTLQHSICITFNLQSQLPQSRFNPSLPKSKVFIILRDDVNLQIILICFKKLKKLKKSRPTSLIHFNFLANFITKLKLFHHNPQRAC